jgi:hypothetical protein
LPLAADAQHSNSAAAAGVSDFIFVQERVVRRSESGFLQCNTGSGGDGGFWVVARGLVLPLVHGQTCV